MNSLFHKLRDLSAETGIDIRVSFLSNGKLVITCENLKGKFMETFKVTETPADSTIMLFVNRMVDELKSNYLRLEED